MHAEGESARPLPRLMPSRARVTHRWYVVETATGVVLAEGDAAACRSQAEALRAAGHDCYATRSLTRAQEA